MVFPWLPPGHSLRGRQSGALFGGAQRLRRGGRLGGAAEVRQQGAAMAMAPRCLPSGKLTVCYWKWPLRNRWFTQLQNGDFPVRYVNVYQRVYQIMLVGGFKHVFHFIYGMSSFPLTTSYFSRWLLHHQPGWFFEILHQLIGGKHPLRLSTILLVMQDFAGPSTVSIFGGSWWMMDNQWRTHITMVFS